MPLLLTEFAELPWIAIAVTVVVAVLATEFAARAIAPARDAGTHVGYTRKIFHFVIFTVAGGVHVVGGFPLTCALGTAVASRVLLAVGRGESDPLFRVLARPEDHPRERLLIVVPLATTAVAGLITAVWAGPVAAVGYLVAGWGDAVGEPVGVRFGRHRYPVLSVGGLSSTRSLEGSAAVFAASAAASAVALGALGHPATVLTVAIVAAGSAVVEAVSPHGTDNLTVPLAATGLTLLSGP